jgi:hypothetical protein
MPRQIASCSESARANTPQVFGDKRDAVIGVPFSLVWQVPQNHLSTRGNDYYKGSQYESENGFVSPGIVPETGPAITAGLPSTRRWSSVTFNQISIYCHLEAAFAARASEAFGTRRLPFSIG